MRSWLAAAAFAMIAAPAPAQAPSALDWLIGTWRGSGTMMSNASEAALEIRPTLGGRFLEFRYSAGQFEGRAFYRDAGGGRWRATWFDNRGVSFPIEAMLDGQALTADWGSAETERGRTVYRLHEDGRLELTDSVAGPDGQMREFARHTLRRAD